jgi:uncharacterized protein (UPF0264 family)
MKNPASNRDDKSGVYRTPDLYQSAFLLTKGLTLIGTERAEGRTLFLFRDEGRVRELVEQYFGNGLIPALSFKSSLRELKSLLHGGFAGERT